MVEQTGIMANLFWRDGGLNNHPSRTLLTSLGPLRKSQVVKKQPIGQRKWGKLTVSKGKGLFFTLHYLQLAAHSVNI